MTADERRKTALQFLSVARQAEADPAMALVYLKGTEDLDPGVLERVCEALGKEPRQDYKSAMPELGTIRSRCEALARADAESAAAQRLLPVPAEHADDDRRTWYFCLDCRDELSGWREMFCHGAGEQKNDLARPFSMKTAAYYCGRKHAHQPHAYVEKCNCYGKNPAVAARNAAMRKPKTEAA
jgi:hypothetical protein